MNSPLVSRYAGGRWSKPLARGNVSIGTQPGKSHTSDIYAIGALGFDTNLSICSSVRGPRAGVSEAAVATSFPLLNSEPHFKLNDCGHLEVLNVPRFR